MVLDVIVSTALVKMYEYECIECARDVFDELVERDVVAHNSMIVVYGSCGLK